MQDQLHRFVFENTPIRGNLVHLDQTYNTALQHHEYPAVLRTALGELMTASALLAATLKLQNGALVLQIQGRGQLKLLVVECSADLKLRATAKWSGELGDQSFSELIGDGQFVITLDQKDGGQPYQGIVPLEGDSIGAILQNYMQRSEQIETRIWLCATEDKTAGMLLQKLPDLPEHDQDAWARTGYLAETVREDELLSLSAEALLRRLFHEETVRLFDAQPVQFYCSCSRTSVSAMLRMLGADEVHDILAEHGHVEVHCDFCNKRYVFDQVDAQQLFTADIVIPASDSRH